MYSILLTQKQCFFFNAGTQSFKLFTQNHGTHNMITYPKEGKAIPLQAWTGP